MQIQSSTSPIQAFSEHLDASTQHLMQQFVNSDAFKKMTPPEQTSALKQLETQLQMQRLGELVSFMSNALKKMHDNSMSVIGNLR